MRLRSLRDTFWRSIARHYTSISALIFFTAIVLPVGEVVQMRFAGPEQVIGTSNHPLGAYNYIGGQYFNNIQALLADTARYHLIVDPALRVQQRAKIEQLRDVLHAQFAKLATSPDVNPKIRSLPGYDEAYRQFHELDADLDGLVRDAIASVRGMNVLFLRFNAVREVGLEFLNTLRATELRAFDEAFASRLAQERAERAYALLLVAALGVVALIVVWALKFAAIAHEQEERALTESRRTVAQRTMLFDAVSHELRTPVQVLLGKIELVQMQESATKRTQALDSLYDAVEGMGRILDNLSQFPRAAAASGPVITTEFDLRDLLERILDHNAGAARMAGKSLVLDMDFSLCRVVSDASRIAQIVENYVQNAIKYASPGAVVVRAIRVQHAFKARKPEAALQISVEDAGPGIGAADRPRIWEPFERLGKCGGSKKGMGLGLALVQLLASYAGWETGLSGGDSSGSKFYVILPLNEPKDS